MVAAGDIRHADLLHRPALGQAYTAGNARVFRVQQQTRPEICLYTREMEQTSSRYIRTHATTHAVLRCAFSMPCSAKTELAAVPIHPRGTRPSPQHLLNAQLYHDTGSLTIAAGLDTGNTQKALALTMTELRRLRESPDHRRRRARDYLIGQLICHRETENQMNRVAEQLLGFDKIIPPDQIKDRLHEVRPSDLRRAAQDFSSQIDSASLL